MNLDSPLTDHKNPRYLEIVEASSKQHQHLIFTCREMTNA
jgi:hypothetical protein